MKNFPKVIEQEEGERGKKTLISFAFYSWEAIKASHTHTNSFREKAKRHQMGRKRERE